MTASEVSVRFEPTAVPTEQNGLVPVGEMRTRSPVENGDKSQIPTSSTTAARIPSFSPESNRSAAIYPSISPVPESA